MKKRRWLSMVVVGAAVLSLAMAAELGERSETRTVGIMRGCLELPETARVVLTENLLDAWLGYVELPERRRVWWATGMWASWLDPSSGQEVVWVRSGDSPGTRYGMVRQGEVDMVVLDTGLVEFLLPGGSERDLGTLETLSSAHRTLRQDECVRPEIELGDRPF